MLELELSSSPSTLSTPSPILFYPSQSSSSPRLLLPLFELELQLRSHSPNRLLFALDLLGYVWTIILDTSISSETSAVQLLDLVLRSIGLPQVLLFRIQYIRELLLLPALINSDEKIIAGLACLMFKIGQAAPALIAEGSTEALVLADALLSCATLPVKIGRLQIQPCSFGSTGTYC